MIRQEGEVLAALTENYATLRPAIVGRATTTLGITTPVAANYYQRSMVAWYEAKVRAAVPYTGETTEFVEAMVRYYHAPGASGGPTNEHPTAAGNSPAGLGQSALDYTPKAVRLDGRRAEMLKQFQALAPAFRELLLMTHYHRIARGRIAAALDLAGGEAQVVERLHKCQTMVREGWEAHNVSAPAERLSPQDEQSLLDYQFNDLEKVQRWAIEARLPTDAPLRKALDKYRDWAAVITLAGRQDLMKVLAREEKRILTVAPPPVAPLLENIAPASAPNSTLNSAKPRTSRPDVTLTRRKRWYNDLTWPAPTTAIAALLVAALLYLAWSTFSGPTSERRADLNFEPYPSIFADSPPETVEDRDLQRILYYYERGDYQTAYDELVPVADGYPAAPLYLGVSALALNDPNRALDWLERIPSNDNTYRAPADWYAALAYLATGREVAAKTSLTDIIATPTHPYRQRAITLLNE